MSQPDLPAILTLVAGVIVIVVMLMLAVTDFLGFVAFSILIAVISFVLYYFGFITLSITPRELDVTYNVNPFAKGQTASVPAPTLNEVFYVSDNTFTYTDPMMDKLMAMLKKNLSSFVVQPFNSKMWAKNPALNIQSSQTATPSASPVPGATQPSTTQTTTPSSPAVTSTLLSAKPSVPEPPKTAPTVTSTSTLDEITGTDPIGIISDLFNNLEQTASNFIN
jgi:cytoskeletal protein RodZ